MNWPQIMKQIDENNIILYEITSKFECEDIENIFARDTEFKKNSNKKVRNGIIENQLNVLPYQMIMLYKVMAFLKKKSTQDLYSQLSSNLEESANFVKQEKQELEVVLNILNLIIDIEKLAKTEYSAPNNFQDTEYAKKVYFENSLFKNYYLKASPDQYEVCNRIMKVKIDEYLENLPLEQKQTLIIESLALSYDRNAFEHLNVWKLFGSMRINPQLEDKGHEEYLSFRKSLITIELTDFENKELSEIYDELKVIYESKFFKEKVLKKEV